MPEWLLPGYQHLGNSHPLIVHFPIALLYVATLTYFVAAVRGGDSWRWTALWILVLGALGAIAAWTTGYEAGEGVMVAQSVRDAILDYHFRLMSVAASLAVVMTVWAVLARPMPARGRWLFLAGLIAMLAVLTVGADYGGRLVWDYNAGGDACPQPIEFSK